MTVTTPDMLIVAGIVAGWLLAFRHAALSKVPRRQFYAASALCLAGAALGTVVCSLYAASEASATAGPWWQNLRGNLLVVLIGACIPPVIYLVMVRSSLAAMADVAAPSLLVAIGFARISCFLKGCCWGDVCCDPRLVARVLDDATRWQVYTIPAICGANWPLACAFPKGSPAYAQHLLFGLLDGTLPGSLPCHPVQLYESALAFIAAAALVWAFPRRAFPLQMLSQACVAYAVIRFALEFVRADHPAFCAGLTSSQVACMALGVVGVLLFIVGRAARKAGTHPNPAT